MPTYTYVNKKTKKRVELEMTIAEMVAYEEKNTHMQRVYEKMNIVDPAGIGVSKPSNDFTKYVLGKVKAHHPKGNVGGNRWKVPREI